MDLEKDIIKLIRSHFENPGTYIGCYSTLNDEVRIIEVDYEVKSTYEFFIVKFGRPPDDLSVSRTWIPPINCKFAYSLLLLSPEEFELIKSKSDRMPCPWNLEEFTVVSR